MDAISFSGAVSAVAGAALSLGGVYAMLRPLRRRLHAFLDEWGGEPARPEHGYEGRPSLPARLASLECRTGRLEAQFSPNSGGSLRDQTDRIEVMLRRHVGLPASVAHAGNEKGGTPD